MRPDFNPLARFSSRVQNYVRYRPDYPPALADFVEEKLGLPRGAVLADVGSGTGKLSVLFLERGYRVIGVEPNDEMREAAEILKERYPEFVNLSGQAEALPLDDRSVQAVMAGQAFHWFDPEKTRAEFARVLAPGGVAMLIWNDRSPDATPFLRSYERLLTDRCPEYSEIASQYANESILRAFFGATGYSEERFHNEQVFDWEGLQGRALSSSYVPASGPEGEAFMSELERIFAEHNEDGKVSFVYATQLFHGSVAT
ncbi:MAG TPA: class I SAM-dependent methyltransferase [Thermoanaerobaculia bacterium]|nr:class I SAM-dependent methyltransferase [Thermoanaerobaculia bacterium]